MYVCMCNCVTDRQLVEAAVEFAQESHCEGVSSFAERVADRLGAGLGCGTCRTFAVELVERAAAEQTSVVLPANMHDPVGLDVAPGSPGTGAFRIASVRESDVSRDLRGETRT